MAVGACIHEETRKNSVTNKSKQTCTKKFANNGFSRSQDFSRFQISNSHRNFFASITIDYFFHSLSIEISSFQQSKQANFNPTLKTTQFKISLVITCCCLKDKKKHMFSQYDGMYPKAIYHNIKILSKRSINVQVSIQQSIPLKIRPYQLNISSTK